MATRWDVEKSVKASNIDPPGRLLLFALLTSTTAGSAEIPPAHVPTYTDLQHQTGLSRSALTEWMKALIDGGWIERVAFESESRPGLRLSSGAPDASRAPRRSNPSAAKTVDAAYRPAVQAESTDVPPGGTDHTAQRYADVPPGGTSSDPRCLIENSPTESSTNYNLYRPSPNGRGARGVKTRKPPTSTAEPREDVERICNYLAEWVTKNGSRRPTITRQWRDEARRLLDLDKKPLDEIQQVIRWCQKDPFWKTNVLSMPTLRKQYDRLRLRWEQERTTQGRLNGGMNGHTPWRNPEDQSVYDDWTSVTR